MSVYEHKHKTFKAIMVRPVLFRVMFK